MNDANHDGEFPKTSFEDRKKEKFINLVLPESDKKLIGSSLHAFWNTYRDTPKEEMPNLIIIPEISGRMALAALDPVIAEIYNLKGLDKPPVVFMVASSVASRAQEKIRVANAENKNSPFLAGIEEARQEKISIQVRSVMEARAKDIVSNTKLGQEVRVLILDDYVSTGGSFNEIAHAFHKNLDLTNWKFEGFALMAGFSDPESAGAQSQLESVSFKFGVNDPHPMPYSSYGWEYRNMGRMWRAANAENHMVHPRKRTMIVRPDFIGVSTDPLSTTRAIKEKDSPIVWRNWIRDSLRKIGNQVVNEIRSETK